MNELAMIDSMPGLISSETGRMLVMAAELVDPLQVIVNVGVFTGKSVFYLAYGAGKDGVKTLAIDPWNSCGNIGGKPNYLDIEVYLKFKKNLNQLGYYNRVMILKGFSVPVAAVWRGPAVGLLFIDDDHFEDSVRENYFAWKPHLADNATVIFNNYRNKKNPGVEVVVNEVIESREFALFEKFDNLAIFTH